ncbi:tyrosine-type recombinase/integrase [Leifsonia sp. Le1]|uniref:tyrosine-type recombinase/integrase n=1 Tax=Leifsonia sp. Le1 TaxID=3404918 RepID=UPI003EB79FE7
MGDGCEVAPSLEAGAKPRSQMGSATGYQSAHGRRFRARWRDASGVQHEKRGFRTKRAALSYVDSVEPTLLGQTFSLPSGARAPVGQLAIEWIENKREALKPSSFAPMHTAWRVYVAPRWGTTPIGLILPSAVEKWVRELAQGSAPTARMRAAAVRKRLSASVVIRAVGVLVGILDVAVRDGRISTNPARGLSNLPRHDWTPRRRYLTHEEVFRLASAMPDDIRETLIITLAYTGIRWGEAVALTAADVDLIRRRLRIYRTATEVEGHIRIGAPKSWQARSVPFPEFLTPRLAVRVSNRTADALVFPSATGGFLRRPDTTFRRPSWWNTALRDAHMDHLTPHALKHTAASLAVSAGANVKALQRMLGHKSAAMTLDTYADLFEDDLDGVAERLNERALANVDPRLLSVR